MTGPTSVASDRVSPMRSSRIAPSSIGSTRSATSSCTQSTRSAEQRWPALSNADVSASATTCSGNAELSTIIAFWPPVSAISTGIVVARFASVRLMSCATSVEPVKQHARDARIGDERGADGLAAAGQQLQRRRRHAGAMEDAHRLVRRSAASARRASRAPGCRRPARR